MNNSIQNICFLVVLAFTPLSAQDLLFKSPDKYSVISIGPINKLGSDWKRESFEKFISISLVKGGALPALWTGFSYQDESGFPPEVIWSRSSETALFLFRPQRGEIVMGVFRPKSLMKYEAILSDAELETLSIGVSDSPAVLKKMWLEKWIEVDEGVYEGDLILAASITRKFHLRLSTKAVPSIVSVLKQKDGE